MAEQAINLAKPMIDLMMDLRVVKRDHLHVVVATFNSAAPNGDYNLVTEQSWKSGGQWEHDYHAIAHGKTAISARTGLTSRKVQLLHPELLVDGDVMFWGNTVLGDIIVSCSGVQPWYDEAISNAVAWLCRAQCQDTTELLRQVARGDTYGS